MSYDRRDPLALRVASRYQWAQERPFYVGETRPVLMAEGLTLRTLEDRECDPSGKCFNRWSDGTVERERGFYNDDADIALYGATLVP